MRFENSFRRTATVLSVPIFLLLVDVYLHPLLVASTAFVGAPNLTEILAQGAVPLGRLRAHRILASIDAIDDPEYLRFLHGTSNALVISTFVDIDNQGYAGGALQSAIERKLKDLAPRDYLELQSLMQRLRGFYPGQLLTLPLHIPPGRYSGFPLDYLLIVALPIGEPESADIKSGLGRALQQAERLELSNVFVPALATNWVRQVDNRAMKLGEVFDTIFDAITPGGYPKQI